MLPQFAAAVHGRWTLSYSKMPRLAPVGYTPGAHIPEESYKDIGPLDAVRLTLTESGRSHNFKFGGWAESAYSPAGEDVSNMWGVT